MTKEALESFRRKGFVESADGQWHKPGSRNVRECPPGRKPNLAPADADVRATPTPDRSRNNRQAGASGISTDELYLNKTERAFLAWLRVSYPNSWIGIQCLQLKLADDCRYCCDFWTIRNGSLHGWEVKGFRREDAWIKLKVAARLYAPAGISFTMVMRIKGEWKFTDVKP